MAKTSWITQAVSLGGHKFTEKEMDLKSLLVDVYQRPIDKNQVDQIVREFNPSIARTLQVSERADGTRWIVDGQHTREALLEKGFATWNCRIHYGLTSKQEAELFVEFNDTSRRVVPTYKFKAMLYAGDPEHVTIANSLLKYGLAIAGTEGMMQKKASGPLTALNSVQMIRGIYLRGNQTTTVLEAALNLAKRAWPKAAITDRYNTRIMPGIATLLLNTTQALDEGRLVKALASHDPIKLQEMVKGVAGANLVIAHTLWTSYINGAGMPRSGSGRKAYSIRQDGQNFPYFSVREFKLNQTPVNNVGVWSPTTDKTVMKSLKKADQKTAYLV